MKSVNFLIFTDLLHKIWQLSVYFYALREAFKKKKLHKDGTVPSFLRPPHPLGQLGTTQFGTFKYFQTPPPCLSLELLFICQQLLENLFFNTLSTPLPLILIVDCAGP